MFGFLGKVLLGGVGGGLKAVGTIAKAKAQIAVARVTGVWGAVGTIGAAGIQSFIKALGGMCLLAMLMGVLLSVFLKKNLE